MAPIKSGARRFNVNIASYNTRQQFILFVSLCSFFVLLNVGSLFVPLTESLTYDEQAYFDSGLAVLSGKPAEASADSLNRNIMPALVLYPLIGNAIVDATPGRLTHALPASAKSKLLVYAAKSATIGVSVLLAIGVFVWARALYGINAGFLGLTLYILDPNVIAHSRVVHQNIFEACSLFIALYSFWKFLRFSNRTNTAVSVASFGIAQITRFTALYLIPIYVALTIGVYGSSVLRLIRNKDFKGLRASIGAVLIYTVLFTLTSILIINIGFVGEGTYTRFGAYHFESEAFTGLQARSSLLRALPVPLPHAYMTGLDFASKMQRTSYLSGPAYLMGRLGIEDGLKNGFTGYYLIAFLYKVPVATQAMILLAFVSLLGCRKQLKSVWRNEAFLLVPSLAFFMVFSLGNAQIGIRYILMIFPLLFVFASRIAATWSTAQARYQVVVIGLLGYLLASNLSYFPHYLSYFNELLPDRKMAYTVLADSNLDWGQNKSYLIDYLRSNPDAMYTQSDIYNWRLPDERLFDPEHPKAGVVVIAANDLVGITAQPARYQWIRERLRPVGHVAYSYLVFNILNQDLP